MMVLSILRVFILFHVVPKKKFALMLSQLTIFASIGVLMWEVFTCGKVPYGRMKNSEVVEMVQRGQVLEKPKGCLNEIYNVSYLCFSCTFMPT